MDNKKNGIPKLRFPGFTGAWEQRKLGEVATFINGRAYKQNELLDSGKYKVLRVGNFYTNDSWYYSNLELADKYYIDEGDLVYTWSATFGPHIWNGEKVIYHYHIWKIELSKFLDRDFTLQILEADKAKLLANTNGSTMIHVTKKDMESKVISLPNIEEQKKIGSYLMKFDSLITLHQRKLEHLQEQKKGLLQKMFPKTGEIVPEVRFPGFTDAWEQRKLGDYLSIPTKEPITDINELKLMTLKLNLEGITLTANRETLKLGATKYYKRHEGQLLYGKQNFFHGSIALIPKEAEGYATSGDVPALDISNVNGKYLVDYISRPSYFKAKEALATGTGSKRIHEKTLLNFKITVPSLEEQNAISDFITNYTNLITLHQRKLDHLELMKKGLLQQMFV